MKANTSYSRLSMKPLLCTHSQLSHITYRHITTNKLYICVFLGLNDRTCPAIHSENRTRIDSMQTI